MSYLSLLISQEWQWLLKKEDKSGIEALGRLIYLIYHTQKNKNNEEQLFLLKLDDKHLLQLKADGQLKIYDIHSHNLETINIQNFESEEVVDWLKGWIKMIDFQSEVWKCYLVSLNNKNIVYDSAYRLKESVQYYYQTGHIDDILKNPIFMLLINGYWIYQVLQPLLIEGIRYVNEVIDKNDENDMSPFIGFPLILYGNQCRLYVDGMSIDKMYFICQSDNLYLHLEIDKDIFYNKDGDLLINISSI